MDDVGEVDVELDTDESLEERLRPLKRRGERERSVGRCIRIFFFAERERYREFVGFVRGWVRS